MMLLLWTFFFHSLLRKSNSKKIKMTFAQGKKTVQTIKKMVSNDKLCLPVTLLR